MKNLVKQAKSNQWKAIVYSIYAFILAFYLSFKFLNLQLIELNSSVMVVIYTMLIITDILTGLMFGFIVFFEFKSRNWKNVKKFRDELWLKRHIHHLRMMEKYIELGNKEKSELLFEQYVNSGYWDQNSASFFDGAIRSKFRSKLDFKITHNGKEL